MLPHKREMLSKMGKFCRLNYSTFEVVDCKRRRRPPQVTWGHYFLCVLKYWQNASADQISAYFVITSGRCLEFPRLKMAQSGHAFFWGSNRENLRYNDFLGFFFIFFLLKLSFCQDFGKILWYHDFLAEKSAWVFSWLEFSGDREKKPALSRYWGKTGWFLNCPKGQLKLRNDKGLAKDS